MPPAPVDFNRLRPMTVFQILDAAVRMYRENFALFVAISVLPTLPLQLAQVASLAMMGDMAQVRAGAANADQQMQAMFLSCGLYGLFVLLHFGIAGPLGTGALVTAITNRYLGKPATLVSSFRPVFRVFWKYLATSMLISLVHGLGMMCSMYILFAFTWTWFLFTPCVMIVEGAWGTAAMNRSRQLGLGHGWRIFGASVAFLVVASVFKVALPMGLSVYLQSQLESPVLQQVVAGSVGIAVSALIDPIWSVLAIMLYFDMRIRKEGYDLALAAHKLGSASPLAA
jgi:hypothetical protein